jgi:hypothetical protein
MVYNWAKRGSGESFYSWIAYMNQLKNRAGQEVKTKQPAYTLLIRENQAGSDS